MPGRRRMTRGNACVDLASARTRTPGSLEVVFNDEQHYHSDGLPRHAQIKFKTNRTQSNTTSSHKKCSHFNQICPCYRGIQPGYPVLSLDFPLPCGALVLSGHLRVAWNWSFCDRTLCESEPKSQFLTIFKHTRTNAGLSKSAWVCSSSTLVL